MVTEVTVKMYRAVLSDVEAQPPWSTTPEHPVVIVTWDEASTFCEAIGGRLPTEAEWEYAARGGREGAIYPWGDEVPSDESHSPKGAVFESDRAQPVKTFGPNGYGLFDMAGNVWEWTADASTLYTGRGARGSRRRARGEHPHRSRRRVCRRQQQPARVQPDPQPAEPNQRERRLSLRPRRRPLTGPRNPVGTRARIQQLFRLVAPVRPVRWG